MPYIKIPLHTVIKLTPKAYGCDEERSVILALLYSLYACCMLKCDRRYTLPIAAVDTHRPKPKTPAKPLLRETMPMTSKRHYYAEEETEEVAPLE